MALPQSLSRVSPSGRRLAGSMALQRQVRADGIGLTSTVGWRDGLDREMIGTTKETADRSGMRECIRASEHQSIRGGQTAK